MIRAQKTQSELRDEIVDTYLHGMTPLQLRLELADRLYKELEAMDAGQLRAECDRWEIDLFNEWED